MYTSKQGDNAKSFTHPKKTRNEKSQHHQEKLIPTALVFIVAGLSLSIAFLLWSALAPFVEPSTLPLFPLPFWMAVFIIYALSAYSSFPYSTRGEAICFVAGGIACMAFLVENTLAPLGTEVSVLHWCLSFVLGLTTGWMVLYWIRLLANREHLKGMVVAAAIGSTLLLALFGLTEIVRDIIVFALPLLSLAILLFTIKRMNYRSSSEEKDYIPTRLALSSHMLGAMFSYGAVSSYCIYTPIRSLGIMPDLFGTTGVFGCLAAIIVICFPLYVVIGKNILSFANIHRIYLPLFTVLLLVVAFADNAVLLIASMLALFMWTILSLKNYYFLTGVARSCNLSPSRYASQGRVFAILGFAIGMLLVWITANDILPFTVEQVTLAVLVLWVTSNSILPWIKGTPIKAGLVIDAASTIQLADDEFNSPSAKFKAKCLKLTLVHGLTLRESEVLNFLARGYHAELIGTILSISQNTAKTHIQSIYRKLNVHSQQELMGMLRDME